MKKIFVIINVFVLLLTSCSSDDGNSSGVLVKKIVSNGNEFIYTYSGNKILNILAFGQQIDYSYSGNLISNIKRFDSFNTLIFETNYFYENDNLIQEITFDYTYGDAEKVEYVHNSNNTISFVRYQNSTGSYTEINHGNYYLNNENEVQAYELFTNSNDLINRLEFTFDTHNNPVKNILGFTKLFSNLENGMYRNIISRNVYDANNVLIDSYLNQYTYNQNDYPETRTTFFNGSSSSSSTSQFYY
ncbi:hypothetical protein [Flavobacterium sp. U410]|jgi:hypothetical protein